ncbi:MAG TPA: energy transducer TonB [Gemmatimonadales bacterium]|nr:energy transducer TonB [Gemmatimonadales bacterium]
MNLQLFASDRKPDALGFTRGGLVSLLVHTAVIGGAIFATLSARQSAGAAKLDTAIVYVQPQEPQHETPPPPELQVPFKGFQTVAVPTTIPTTIPPVDLQEHFDPKDFSGVGVEGGTATGVTPPSGDQVYSTLEVDQPPVRLSAPPLERDYPNLLRQAGITGRVIIEAVIDTTGKAELTSIAVVQTPHPGFNEAAKRWMAQALFRPARKGGNAVRVLVRQAIDFSLSN